MPKSGSFDSFSACTRRFSGLEIGWLRLVVAVALLWLRWVHVGSDFIMWAHTLSGGPVGLCELYFRGLQSGVIFIVIFSEIKLGCCCDLWGLLTDLMNVISEVFIEVVSLPTSRFYVSGTR